ncbi:hypothetical protein [Chamaesiphon minutus]|uniref:Secreted protein n=1 Tax=Chamaesiphon minutus (strain ATCC 27169 / PCC 6605) TaxID=1173020 RepID=K9UEM8_CHAP6|nr:hypothetical protein [Chamaesiphon minutus]AFY93108.1 hypothetical protein Cha6605_2007 [Chamaesiphon minutus PCC 6605]
MLLESLFSELDTIGFSGSRSLSGAGLAVLASLFPLVPAGCHVVVGCAAGADLAVRSAFGSGNGDGRLCLFAVASGRWGTGRAAFARRSAAIVEAIPLGGLLVVIPGSVSPPPGVTPSRSFRGGGSGSWGSAALALGSGRRVLLWLPVGYAPPAWAGVAWSAVDGWWLGVSSSQLSIF